MVASSSEACLTILCSSNLAKFQKLRQLKKTQLETEVNNPSFNNDRDTYSLNGHLVDKEYGLFDNRMKLGDEQVWFKKFRDMEV